MPEGMESKELFAALKRSYSRYTATRTDKTTIPFLKTLYLIILKKRTESRPNSNKVAIRPTKKVYSLPR